MQKTKRDRLHKKQAVPAHLFYLFCSMNFPILKEKNDTDSPFLSIENLLFYCLQLQ
jgi:hypothetical protein